MHIRVQVTIPVTGPDSVAEPIPVHFCPHAPETSPTPKIQSKPDVKSQPALSPQPKTDTKSQPKSNSRLKSQPKSNSRPSSQPKPKSQPKPRSRRRLTPERLLIIFSGVALIACLAVGAGYLIDSWRQHAAHQDLTATVITPAADNSDPSAAKTIDFTALLATNPDTVAWIEIPDTNINYPVVQTTNNETYLSRTFDGGTSISGTIFLDADNAADFTNVNSILYGHHRYDRTMFADLDLIYNGSLAADTPIYLYLPDGSRATYRVFSAYITENDPVSIDPATSDFAAFATTMLARSKRDFGLDPLSVSPQFTSADASPAPTDHEEAPSPRVLTLSTCVANDDRRYLIHAVLTELQLPSAD